MPEPTVTEEEKTEQVVSAFEQSGAQRGGESDEERQPPAQYAPYYNYFSFNSKTSLENLWMALQLLDGVFELQEKKISKKQYKIKYTVLDENSEEVKFEAQIF